MLGRLPAAAAADRDRKLSQFSSRIRETTIRRKENVLAALFVMTGKLR
jgi:hypothetical protein